MKKVTLLVLVALLVVSFTVSVFAAPAQAPAQTLGSWYCPYYGQSFSNLTDEQKAQIDTWRQQTLEQRKQMLQKQVGWGYVTQEQADLQISQMEQQMASGVMLGHSMGHGIGGHGMKGHGMGHY